MSAPDTTTTTAPAANDATDATAAASAAVTEAAPLTSEERAELDAYRAVTAAEAVVAQAVADRNAAQHDPLPPVVAGVPAEEEPEPSGT